MASYIRTPDRKTCKFMFADNEAQHNAYETVAPAYPDVQIQKIGLDKLLVNLTGSKMYDIKVYKELEKLGGTPI